MFEKEVLVLKKSKYTTKDNKDVYRLHLWLDDGAVEYCVVSVTEEIYELSTTNSKIKFGYDLNIFNGKIYGIKNVHFV